MRARPVQLFGLLFAALLPICVVSVSRAAPCDGFTDVDSANSNYCPAVTYLKDKGITLGCTGTTYCPNDPVTRLQMALFLQRAGRGDASNSIGSSDSFIGSGTNNTTDTGGTNGNVIGGGDANKAIGGLSFVGSGFFNLASGADSVVSGGFGNTASGGLSVVTGGQNNTASGLESSVDGGAGNVASGDTSAILGGTLNTAAGANSFALGHRAKTTVDAQGSFVFGDSTNTDVTSANANEFIVAASGGIRMLSDKSGTLGCSMAGGGGTWECSSSHDVKRDFEDIDRQQVLDRVLALPVQTWRYKNEAPEIRHMGTFAQDFRAAFGLGSDDRTISMADADGVALAAIQALNAKLEAIVALQAHELAEMKAQLNALAATR